MKEWNDGEAKDGLLSRRIYLQIMADCTHGQPEMPRSLAAETCCCWPLMLVDVSFRFSFHSPSFSERRKKKMKKEKKEKKKEDWTKLGTRKGEAKRWGIEKEERRYRNTNDHETSWFWLVDLAAAAATAPLDGLSPILVETVDDDDHFVVLLVIYAARLRNAVVRF